MNIRLIRRRFTLGVTAALLGTALILSACGDDEPEIGEPAITQPGEGGIVTEGEVVEGEVVEGEVVTETAEGEAETEVEVEIETEGGEASETIVEETVITETDVITTELITETVVITESEVMTQVEVMEATPTPEAEGVMTETVVVTETEVITVEEEQQQQGQQQQGQQLTQAAVTGAGVTGLEQEAYVRASTLIDYSFENADGEVSGEIEDLLIDMQSGRVLATSIEYGGFLDIGDTEISLPLSAFAVGPEGELVLNFDEATLEAFPDMGDEWPNAEDPGWDDEFNTFWTEQGIETGFDFQQPGTGIRWASDLVGYGITDVGAGAGQIQDMIVDLSSGQVKYVVVGDELGIDQGPLLVPFSAFNTQEIGTELTYAEDYDPAWAGEAPRLDETTYPQGQPLGAEFDDDVEAWWAERGFDFD